MTPQTHPSLRPSNLQGGWAAFQQRALVVREASPQTAAVYTRERDNESGDVCDKQGDKRGEKQGNNKEVQAGI
jgi:hypothetical protein